MPWLNGETPDWRDYAISEFDFSATPMCKQLGLETRDARLFMVFDGRYKLTHFEGGFPPMLFDLQSDPEEFFDLAKAGDHQSEIDRLYECLRAWGLRMSQRVTRSEDDIVVKPANAISRKIRTYSRNSVIDGNSTKITTLIRSEPTK